MRRKINLARELTPDGIIGVNILMAALWREELIRAAVGSRGERSKINYLVVGAGFHEDVPLWVKDHPEVSLILLASSDLAAIKMAKIWFAKHQRLPDAIIMEEPATAGGHLGATFRNVDSEMLRLEHTIPGLLERFSQQDFPWDIPIIAAGGICDRPGIDRVFKLGAKGVQMATRFVCTPECDAPDVFKDMYAGVKEGDIVIVESPAGYPGRAIRNGFIEKLLAGEINDRCRGRGGCLIKCACRDKGTHFCLLNRLYLAYEGDAKNGLFFCGSNAPLAKGWGIEPLNQVIENLMHPEKLPALAG